MSNVSVLLRNQISDIRNSDLRSTMVSQVSYYPTEGNRPEDQIYKGQDLKNRLAKYYEYDEKINVLKAKLRHDEDILLKKPEDKNSIKSRNSNLNKIKEIMDK